MARKKRNTSLSAPFLKRLALIPDIEVDRSGYPFDQPWLGEDFELEFTAPVTVIMGENGTGKSTLIEAIAALSGYDEAGGGKGYRPVDHHRALDRSGATLGDALRAGWLPRITDGWFFRAESFFSVARYQDRMALEHGGVAPDFLSWSHGEGIMRFFEERMQRQGIYFLDEPESALSPKRQIEMLRILAGIQDKAISQVIMATHSPILMAVPGAQLLRLSWHGFDAIDYRDTDHFRLYQSFTVDPEEFVSRALHGDVDGLW